MVLVISDPIFQSDLIRVISLPVYDKQTAIGLAMFDLYSGLTLLL